MTENRAHQLAQQGKAAFESGKFLEAAQIFEAARAAFHQNGRELDAAEMANNRSVALLKAGDAEGALQATIGTEEIFARAGDKCRQAIALSNQASAMEELGQLEQALELYQKSSNLFEQCGNREMRSYVLRSISALYVRMGKQFNALASMNEALNSTKKLTLKERLLKKLINLPFRILR